PHRPGPPLDHLVRHVVPRSPRSFARSPSPGPSDLTARQEGTPDRSCRVRPGDPRLGRDTDGVVVARGGGVAAGGTVPAVTADGTPGGAAGDGSLPALGDEAAMGLALDEARAALGH